MGSRETPSPPPRGGAGLAILRDVASKRRDRESAWEVVYELVRGIPPGRVMTYGQIGMLVEPLSARAVGWALNVCPGDVPWHRVVNSRGGCSTDRLPHIPTGLQRSLLEREGVEFDSRGRLSLPRYRWFPQDKP
jgi:methylated-DNA-protein-cysteine methyltransferase related protein